MTYTFTPQGVCSRKMELEIEDGIITDVRIESGCHGNLQGIMQLIKGARATEVADKLRGIRCGSKDTSCPDQLSVALEKALALEQRGCANA